MFVCRRLLLIGPGAALHRAHRGGEGHRVESSPAWHSCIGGRYCGPLYPVLQQSDLGEAQLRRYRLAGAYVFLLPVVVFLLVISLFFVPVWSLFFVFVFFVVALFGLSFCVLCFVSFVFLVSYSLVYGVQPRLVGSKGFVLSTETINRLDRRIWAAWRLFCLSANIHAWRVAGSSTS